VSIRTQFAFNYHNFTKGGFIYRASIGGTTNIGFFVGAVNPNSGHGETTSDAVGIAYDTGADETNYMGVTRSGATSTRHRLELRQPRVCMTSESAIASQDDCARSIDGGTETTNSTNVPNAAGGITQEISVYARTTAAAKTSIDYFWMALGLTR
jgi:hypothetical protein